MTCENCVSFKVCHAVALAGKMVNAEVQCDYFIDKDLINRQKAEIERLNGNLFTISNACKQRRAEAVKEFAEELIYKIVNTPTKFESTYYMYREGIAFRQNEIIDIIKEMAGEIDV